MTVKELNNEELIEKLCSIDSNASMDMIAIKEEVKEELYSRLDDTYSFDVISSLREILEDPRGITLGSLEELIENYIDKLKNINKGYNYYWLVGNGYDAIRARCTYEKMQEVIAEVKKNVAYYELEDLLDYLNNKYDIDAYQIVIEDIDF